MGAWLGASAGRPRPASDVKGGDMLLVIVVLFLLFGGGGLGLVLLIVLVLWLMGALGSRPQ